jgi:hypothetical protein
MSTRQLRYPQIQELSSQSPKAMTRVPGKCLQTVLDDPRAIFARVIWHFAEQIRTLGSESGHHQIVHARSGVLTMFLFLSATVQTGFRSMHMYGCGMGPGVMPEYRFYVIKPDGHIAGPADVVECQDDAEATERATGISGGRAIEIWQLNRFVARFELKD